jgi:hypothetical protein
LAGANSRCGDSERPACSLVTLFCLYADPACVSSPSPLAGEGWGGGYPSVDVSAELPPTPDPSPPRKCVGGGEEEDTRVVPETSRFATSPLAPFVEARARWAAASPPARRSQELSGGGCRPVEEPTPLSPRLIAGLSSSAKAGPIGCTSGRCAFDFGVLPGFLGLSGFFAIAFRIWDESGPEKRAKAARGTSPAASRSRCQQVSVRGLIYVVMAGLVPAIHVFASGRK